MRFTKDLAHMHICFYFINTSLFNENCLIANYEIIYVLSVCYVVLTIVKRLMYAICIKA